MTDPPPNMPPGAAAASVVTYPRSWAASGRITVDAINALAFTQAVHQMNGEFLTASTFMECEEMGKATAQESVLKSMLDMVRPLPSQDTSSYSKYVSAAVPPPSSGLIGAAAPLPGAYDGTRGPEKC